MIKEIFIQEGLEVKEFVQTLRTIQVGGFTICILEENDAIESLSVSLPNGKEIYRR